MRSLWVGLIVILAGCLAQAPAETAPPVVDVVAQPTDIPYRMDRCDGTAVALMVEPERVRGFLPAGYHPRDARDLFQLQVATGKVPVFVAAMDCPEDRVDLFDGFTYGFVGIFVERPGITHASLASTQSEFDFYVPGYYTDDADLAPLLASWEVPVVPAAVQVDAPASAAPPLAYASAGTATLAGQTVFRFEIPGGAPLVPAVEPYGFQDFPMRLWTETPSGTAMHGFRFTHNVTVGPPVSCQFATGSWTHDATGHVDCGASLAGPTGLDLASGALFHGLQADAQLLWLPEVFV